MIKKIESPFRVFTSGTAQPSTIALDLEARGLRVLMQGRKLHMARTIDVWAGSVYSSMFAFCRTGEMLTAIRWCSSNPTGLLSSTLSSRQMELICSTLTCSQNSEDPLGLREREFHSSRTGAYTWKAKWEVCRHFTIAPTMTEIQDWCTCLFQAILSFSLATHSYQTALLFFIAWLPSTSWEQKPRSCCRVPFARRVVGSKCSVPFSAEIL